MYRAAFQKDYYKAAESYLKQQTATLGIVQLLDKTDLAQLYHNPLGNSRTHPDFVAVTQHGVIYTGGTKLRPNMAGSRPTIAMSECSFPILPSPSATDTDVVETRRIAPTVLNALGIKPNELQSAREENTKGPARTLLIGATSDAAAPAPGRRIVSGNSEIGSQKPN